MQLFTYVYNSITITPTHGESTYRTKIHGTGLTQSRMFMSQSRHVTTQIWLIGALTTAKSKAQRIANHKGWFGDVWGSYSRGKCTSFSSIILVFGVYNLYRSIFFKHGKWPQESDSQRQEWCDISPRCLCHARKLAWDVTPTFRRACFVHQMANCWVGACIPLWKGL